MEAAASVDFTPSEMYCLSCRRVRKVTDVKLVDTTFQSKKNKTVMCRKTWIGKCECGKDVRQFAKVPVKVEPAEAPKAQ